MITAFAPPTRPPVSDALVSVVVPVFNEAEVLDVLCQRLRTALTLCRTTFEIIFVDDGSRDGGAELLDALARRFAEVRVIHLSRNFGHQAAIVAGLKHAQGDAVVLMDADLQDPPEAIGKLLERWQAGYDVVYAVRTHRKEAAWKRFLFGAFYRVLSSIAHTPIPVDAGNLGLIDARVARTIVELAERDRYFPGLRSWVGFKQIGVPVERGWRYDHRPRVPLAGLLRLAKTAVFSFSMLPLAVFGWIGGIALAVFVIVSGYSLYCKWFTDLALPAWTSGAVAISFFTALNALGIRVLGEYLVRIYDQVRARPLYLIDRTVNLGHEESAEKMRGEESASHFDAVDLEHLDPLNLESEWDGAYQHLLSQANDLLELGSLMRSESDDLADRSGHTTAETLPDPTPRDGNGNLHDDEPQVLKMSKPRGSR